VLAAGARGASPGWREAPIVASIQQFGVRSIFESPLVVGGIVYVGSADGNRYALE